MTIAIIIWDGEKTNTKIKIVFQLLGSLLILFLNANPLNMVEEPVSNQLLFLFLTMIGARMCFFMLLYLWYNDCIFAGVPLQQVSDEGSADRDRVSPPAERDPGEDLVPEPADEAEEADEGGVGSGRADLPERH